MPQCVDTVAFPRLLTAEGAVSGASAGGGGVFPRHGGEQYRAGGPGWGTGVSARRPGPTDPQPGTHLTNLDGPWWIVRKRAGLEEVRLHDCRHSFASRALALGESLPVIVKLLGHSQIQTTARYAHLARDSVKTSAARVAASIAGDFLHGSGSERASHSER